MIPLDFDARMTAILVQGLRALAAHMLDNVQHIPPTGDAHYDAGFQAGARHICVAIERGAEKALLEAQR